MVTVAEVGGGVFSTLFSICSTFSILAGVLLIFLIFVMLAAERKSELGMARAVGMQRGHLIQMFVAEGLVYDLAAAALGLGLGLLISYAMIGYLSGLFRGIGQQFGSMAGVFRFYFHVTRPIAGHLLLPGRAAHLRRGRHRVLAREPAQHRGRHPRPG